MLFLVIIDLQLIKLEFLVGFSYHSEVVTFMSQNNLVGWLCKACHSCTAADVRAMKDLLLSWYA